MAQRRLLRTGLNQPQLEEDRPSDPDGLARCGAALAHVHRVRLLQLLAAGPLTPTAIARALGIAPNLVIHHLRFLQALGWIAVELGDDDHRAVRYRLVPELLRAFIAQLTALTTAEASHPSAAPDPALLAPWAATGDPAFVVDHTYRIRLWNSAAERYLGHRPQQVLGKPCTEVLQGCDPAGRLVCTFPCRPRLRLAAGAPPAAFPLAVRAADGTQRPSVMSLVPLPGGWVAHLVHTGERLHQLEQFLSQLQALLRALEGAPAPAGTPPPPPPVHLTPREQEVLALLAQGARTDDLMRRLVVTRSTVRKHVQSLLHKLGARNRLEAVSIARRRGLLP